MAKKSDVKKEVVEEVELQKSEQVLVEMTPAQRDKFVKMLAEVEEEEIPADKGPEFDDKYKLDLFFAHHIGPYKFGPGRKIEVPERFVGHLQVYEQGRREQEMNLNNSNKKLFEIMQSGQAIQRVSK